MFEFDKYEPALRGEAVVPPSSGYEPPPVAKMSLLLWGEHCVECAAPACFKTCDLYQARPDGRCRRFRFGAFENRGFPSLRGYGAEVSFKKWAKLEARGNTKLTTTRSIRRQEALLSFLAPAVNALGRSMGWLTGDPRWAYATQAGLERLGRWLHRRRGSATSPEAFLLDVYNPGTEPIKLQLSMTIARREIREPAVYLRALPEFHTTILLAPGYSRHQFEAALFRGVTEANLPFDVTLVPEERPSDTRLVFLTADFVTFGRPRGAGQSTAKQVKCVAWDLDRTLWEGVLVEDGNLELKPHVRELLQALDERGILLSIVSKNDHDAAMAKLAELGLAEHFLRPQIGWQPKSQGVEQVARALNIGLDSIAFIDDNGFELAEVARAHPEVLCLPADAVGPGLLERPEFKGGTTADARNRRRLYQEAQVREEAQARFDGNYRDFLRASGIVLEIDTFSDQDRDRVVELAQRTNQLNFSGHKYTREEFERLAVDAGVEKYVLRCADNFGSYGVVGFGVVKREEHSVEVREFMLSCRVQAKFLEQAFFGYLVQPSAVPARRRLLLVRFRATGRNVPAQQVLNALGFEASDRPDTLALDPSVRSLECDFIRVIARVPQGGAPRDAAVPTRS